MKLLRPDILGVAVLVLGILAAVACTQQAEPTPTLQARESSQAYPTSAPTDRSVPPPTLAPTAKPTRPPAVIPTVTPEPGATPGSVYTPAVTPTSAAPDTPFSCAGLSPTNTPDPNRADGILGMSSEFWNVSSFAEAECYTGYPIAVPSHLPDGFVQSETIIVNKVGTSDWEDVFVEHGWSIPGDPPYGIRLSQHTRMFSLGDGEPAVINGLPGERELLTDPPPDFPPGLSFLWKQDGYWFTVFGWLHGPITEEFLLKVAASLQFPEEGPG